MSISILVPTDFSKCSSAAYSYAGLLAERTNATIYLLHILDIPSPSLIGNNETETQSNAHFMTDMRKLAKSGMSKIRNGKKFKNAEVQEIIEVGSVTEKILSAVKKYEIDLLLMGTHGTHGLREKFIGTNAEKTVRSAEIPVLSIKHEVKNPTLETIMLATDFSKEAEEILPTVHHVAELLKATLILTKIITPDKFETAGETKRQIEKFKMQKKSYSYYADTYYANSKEEGIRHAAESCGAGMIALGTYGRHGLSRFFQGSVTEDVVTHSLLPVLTVNFHRALS